MYTEEEVVFTNGDTRLAGTLTLPDKRGGHPAIVMKAGSGPLNRDEEYLGFKPFKIIADHFTRQGIATLRYDSRGVGGSTGNVWLSTFPDFANDVMAAIDCLQNRSEINSSQIGVCGHSEGGFVAPLCASNSDDVAFIILISGGGVSGEKGILAQTELIMKADGEPEDKINDTELGEIIDRAIQQIPEKYRDSFVLREINQLSYEEIAAVTGLKLGTVRSRINRARNCFRRIIEPILEMGIDF